MNEKKPMIKETVGAQYYAFNKPDDKGNYVPKSTSYEETIKTNVVKKVGTSENVENTPVKASGIDYLTASQIANIDLAVEVVAFPIDDLAEMRGEDADEGGLITTKTSSKRPFFAYGKVVKKIGGGFRFDWYPKCQLIENTDDVETKEDTFKEQNDTVTIRAYAYDAEGKNIKVAIDSEATNFPKGMTEEKFFKAPILTKEDLATANAEVIEDPDEA